MEAKVQRQMLAALAQAMGMDGITPDTIVGTVERMGDKIIVPKDANLDEVIQNLTYQRDREAEMINLSSDYPVPPWDGTDPRRPWPRLPARMQPSGTCGSTRAARASASTTSS